ncbi:MAG TPA: MBL fold metallo-hydrolase, partial [Puia sp.]|nr:MBL fold metallo-hydrolase [Puia sp.]
KGSLLVEVQPFVVITSRDVLLFDTGLGFETGGVSQLHRNLNDAGINVSDVTKVLLSHLHKDHSGGVSLEGDTGNPRRVSFPGATYYLQKQELEYAMQKGFPSYIIDDFEPLQAASNVVLLDGNGTIDDYIRYELTGAHCPYHQVFWVAEDNSTIFFGGDVAPQLQQMKSRFIAKYDYDGKRCMELRKQWWMEGEKGKWTFLFYHDIKTPTFSF